MDSSEKFTILCGSKKSASKDLNRLTKIAAEHIMENHNEILIGRIITDHFSDSGVEDVKEATEYCTRYINDLCKPMLQGYLKGPIIESQPCNIDGLVNFRLQQYRQFLQSTMEGILYTYMEGKRYMELIQAMKYLVSIIQVRNETIHITLKETRISVYDNDMKRIQHEPFDPMISALISNSYETTTDTDIAINTIINAAPQYIILHSENRNPKISELIRHIYGHRVSNCTTHCKLCEENNVGTNI